MIILSLVAAINLEDSIHNLILPFDLGEVTILDSVTLVNFFFTTSGWAKGINRVL